MAKSKKRKQRNGAGQNRSHAGSQKGRRRTYVVRAVVTVGMLLAAIGVLALVQQPNLPGQPAAQNAETQVESATEVENMDTAGQMVPDTGDSDVASGPALAVAPAVGALAPDFTLDNIAGQKVSRTGFAGQPMFVTFFHSW